MSRSFLSRSFFQSIAQTFFSVFAGDLFWPCRFAHFTSAAKGGGRAWQILLAKRREKRMMERGGLVTSLTIDGLKHLDVEPGVSRFGLATSSRWITERQRAWMAAELHIAAGRRFRLAVLARFTKSDCKSWWTKLEKARFFVSPDDLFAAGKVDDPLLAKIKGLHVVTGTKSKPVQ